MLAAMASAAVKKKAAQARRQRQAAAQGPAAVAPGPSSARGRVLPELSSRQALWAGVAGLVVIALLSYGWYIRHGGIWDDDWAVTSALIHDRSDGGGWWAGIKELYDTTSWRPVLVAYGGLIGAPLGWHLTAQYLWVTAITTGVVALLYQVLRTRGIPSPHAFAVAALVLVSTFGDAGTLWISGGAIRFAGLLYLGGLLLALHALRADDQRRALRRHVLAGLLYLLSILSYEVTAGCLWAGVLVYLGAAPRGRVLRRWGADLAISAVGLIWSATHTPRPSHSLADSLDHAGAIVREFWKLYDGVVAPHWLPDHTAGVLTVIALLGGLAVLGVRARGGLADARFDALARWSQVLAVAVVFVAATYVIFVPGDSYYLPNGAGTSNRMNTLAVAPTLLAGYAALMVFATAALLLARRPAVRVALAVGLLYAFGMFVTSERALRADQHTWAGDYAVSRGVLSSIRQAVPDPASGTFLVVLGAPYVRPSGNPVFYSSWDLASAVRKIYSDGSLDAFNAYQGVQCTADGLVVPGTSGNGDYSTQDTNGVDGTISTTAAYGRTMLVDAARGKGYALPDQMACQRALQTITR